MTDLQDRLCRLAPTVDTDGDLAGLHRRVRLGRRRRRITANVLASAALIGAGIVAVVVVDPSEEAGTRVITQPENGRPDIVEGWVDLPDAPLPATFEPAAPQAVWTGDEFLWWGGAGDGQARTVGAAFDPETRQWRPMTEAPIRARSKPIVVWTGEEMVVWGGGDVASGVPYSGVRYDAAGAAYDPDTDEWRVIADAPIEARESAAAAWDGHRLLVAGGERFDGPPECPDLDTCLSQGQVGLPTVRAQLDGAAYDPITDEWETIADAPAVPGSAVTWDGEEMVTFSGRAAIGGEITASAGLAYDPEQDAWTDLSMRTNQGGALVDPGFTAAGGVVVAIERAGEAVGAWFVYDPAADQWVQAHELPPDIFAVCSPTATAAGDAIAVLGCGQAAYAPETASWYLLDELPVEPRGLADILTVGALGANDQIVMAMNPRFDPTRPGPRPNGDGSRFVAYEGDFSTYTVPDVEGLPLGAAHRIMAADGFVLSAHRTDPQGDDAVVRVQEPPPGTRALGIAPEIGVRTDPPGS